MELLSRYLGVGAIVSATMVGWAGGWVDNPSQLLYSLSSSFTLHDDLHAEFHQNQPTIGKVSILGKLSEVSWLGW